VIIAHVIPFLSTDKNDRGSFPTRGAHTGRGCFVGKDTGAYQLTLGKALTNSLTVPSKRKPKGDDGQKVAEVRDVSQSDLGPSL
jgi:hypothetical protein